MGTKGASPKAKPSVASVIAGAVSAVAFWRKGFRGQRLVAALFEDTEPEPENGVVADEAGLLAQEQALIRRIRIQSFVILGLIVSLFILIPVLKPIYIYEAMKPTGEKMELVPLSAPNLTDQAILSWSATSITEILTFGFGDFDQRILSQRPSFTSEGWQAFTKAIREEQLRSQFKQRQLVLTTVPSNMPVIVNKGEDIDGLYKWLVEMPVVMTYTTNNNVATIQKSIVKLTIVRVPPSENIMGIGIKGWQLL